jgi:hypothetical protein
LKEAPFGASRTLKYKNSLSTFEYINFINTPSVAW